MIFCSVQDRRAEEDRTEPRLDRDQSGPFCGTDGLGSVRSTGLRLVFGLPYLHGKKSVFIMLK